MRRAEKSSVSQVKRSLTSLPREERLRSGRDIERLFHSGKRVQTFGAKLFFSPNGLPYNRVGFTLKKGYGNAVERNRVKRIFRAAFRSLKGSIKIGFDLLLLIFPMTDNENGYKKDLATPVYDGKINFSGKKKSYDYWTRKEQLKGLLKRAFLLC